MRSKSKICICKQWVALLQAGRQKPRLLPYCDSSSSTQGSQGLCAPCMKPQKGKEWRRAPRACFWTWPRSSPHGFCSPFTGQNLVTGPCLLQGWAMQSNGVPRKKRPRTMGTERHIFLDLPLMSPTLGQLSDTPVFYFLCSLGFLR